MWHCKVSHLGNEWFYLILFVFCSIILMLLHIMLSTTKVSCQQMQLEKRQYQFIAVAMSMIVAALHTFINTPFLDLILTHFQQRHHSYFAYNLSLDYIYNSLFECLKILIAIFIVGKLYLISCIDNYNIQINTNLLFLRSLN